MPEQIMLRKGKPADLKELQQLFVDTITSVCSADYNAEQILVWTSGVENKQRWNDIITNQFVLVAQYRNKIVGFATLDDGNYLDLLYVHKDYQRKGIAQQLYANVEKEAKQRGQKELTADVSKTARPFFERVGFNVVKEQTVNIKNVELKNYKMIITLK